MSNEYTNLYKTIGKLEAKVESLHRRIDDRDKLWGADIKEVKGDVKKLLAKENQRIGFTAAMVLVGSLISAAIGWYMKG